MALPRTLRDVSGLPPEPASLRSPAPMMIDLQNTYREGVMQLEGVEPALLEAQALLGGARDAGLPIVHLRQGDVADQAC